MPSPLLRNEPVAADVQTGLEQDRDKFTSPVKPICPIPASWKSFSGCGPCEFQEKWWGSLAHNDPAGRSEDKKQNGKKETTERNGLVSCD